MEVDGVWDFSVFRGQAVDLPEMIDSCEGAPWYRAVEFPAWSVPERFAVSLLASRLRPSGIVLREQPEHLAVPEGGFAVFPDERDVAISDRSTLHP